MPTGSERIHTERIRQMLDEHFDAAHDDAHRQGDLLCAARCYIAAATHAQTFGKALPAVYRSAAPWPWDESWWRPSDDPVRNLEKAGALIAAEIDRLQRTKKTAA